MSNQLTPSNSWMSAALGLVFSAARAVETFGGFIRTWRTRKGSASTSKKTDAAESTKTDRTTAK